MTSNMPGENLQAKVTKNRTHKIRQLTL